MTLFSMKFAYDKLIRWTGYSQWWVLCGAIMIEPAMDTTITYLFEKKNEGKLWKDLEQNIFQLKTASKQNF